MGQQSNLNAGQTIGLPPVIFMFTLDQIASMLNIEEMTLRTSYLYFNGRTTGLRKRSHMMAINIGENDAKPDWRVSHQEFVKWLKRHGFRTNQLSVLT